MMYLKLSDQNDYYNLILILIMISRNHGNTFNQKGKGMWIGNEMKYNMYAYCNRYQKGVGEKQAEKL